MNLHAHRPKCITQFSLLDTDLTLRVVTTGSSRTGIIGVVSIFE